MKLCRSGKLNDGESWEMPTSMIDVVFLLLIFFMCASKFQIIEQRLQVLLPGGHSGIGPITEELTLEVGYPGGQRQIPLYRLGKWSCSDPNLLAGRLKQLADISKVRIVIDGGQDCPFRHMISALDACARAELTDVGFRPPPPQSRIPIGS
jgi:biopolymer transport protein ExbD